MSEFEAACCTRVCAAAAGVSRAVLCVAGLRYALACVAGLRYALAWPEIRVGVGAARKRCVASCGREERRGGRVAAARSGSHR
eukprot:2892505-Rhodomonas_salina.1